MGLALFPMMHMFSLALTPTYTIGLNKDFKFPKAFEVVCNSKPSAFAYPKKLEEKKEEKKKRVETVTLSATAKEKARLARKRAKEGGGDAEVSSDKKDDDKKESEEKESMEETKKDVDAMDIDKEKEEGDETEKKKKKREPEPTSFQLGNPARITKAQSDFCSFDLTQRYRPIRPNENPYGVIVLTDSTPDQEEDVGAVLSPSLEPDGELPPPESFEWNPPPPPPPPTKKEPKEEKKKTEESKEEDAIGDNDKEKEKSTGDEPKPMEE